MRAILATILLLILAVVPARAIDQAKPDKMPVGHPPVEAMPLPHEAAIPPTAKGDRSQFERQIDLSRLRLLFVQHNDQLKILDSWARQSMAAIRNRQSIDGRDPLYTALDMAFRPEAWADANIVYVQAVPIRQELARLATTPEEQQRIMTHATVSPRFLSRPDVSARLEEIARNTVLAPSVNKVLFGLQTFSSLGDTLLLAPEANGRPWHHPLELQGNNPETVALAAKQGVTLPPVPGVSAEKSRQIVKAFSTLVLAWQDNDVATANRAIGELCSLLPAVRPGAYPTPARATVELWYNRTFNGTIVAFAYIAAFVLFSISAMAGLPRVRKPAVAIFALAVLAHAAAMGVRWYLAGRIPIQNQFESVLGAALFGCVVGLVLELWRKNGLFGMAMSAVGMLAMVCCFVFPFVVGTDMGATIGKVAGILNNTVWLYIHVDVVIASYAMIAASAIMGLAYLGVRLWHWINPLDPAYGPDTGQIATVVATRRGTLEAFDAANVVLMQTAFWMLGVGIVFGAIWADVSWGRPWGWDPKETFALVTWIVYLILVHVRLFSPRVKGDWTAALSVAGFGVMLFNWIGVNFFLAGLHSYA